MCMNTSNEPKALIKKHTGRKHAGDLRRIQCGWTWAGGLLDVGWTNEGEEDAFVFSAFLFQDCVLKTEGFCAEERQKRDRQAGRGTADGIIQKEAFWVTPSHADLPFLIL